MTIPIAKPFLDDQEVLASRNVIQSGWVTQGPKVKKFEEDFAQYVGAKHACAVANCTAALHLALLAVGVKPGNVVVTVSHSFIATANSIRYCFAEPVFVDIDLETFNISADRLKDCLENDCKVRSSQLYYKNINRLAKGESPLCYLKSSKEFGRVAAILVVHQMGMPCDLKNILPLAKKYRIPVIEDAACALGSEISTDQGKSFKKIGQPHGDLACFSFHPRKILTTGDGGMITTNNARFIDRLKLLRQHGMTVSDLKRHQSRQIIFESYDSLGYNYRMTDIQAAIGMEQLKKLDVIFKKRREIASFYNEQFRNISWLKIPTEPQNAKTNWQSYCLRVLKSAPLTRDQLMQHLLDAGISTRAAIMNSHQEKPYRAQKWSLPISEKARKEGIILPLYHYLTQEELHKIVETIKSIDV